MPQTLLSTYDELIIQLKQEGRWSEKTEQESGEMLKKIEDEMSSFRFEKQQKVKATQEELASLVLTA